MKNVTMQQFLILRGKGEFNRICDIVMQIL